MKFQKFCKSFHGFSFTLNEITKVALLIVIGLFQK